MHLKQLSVLIFLCLCLGLIPRALKAEFTYRISVNPSTVNLGESTLISWSTDNPDIVHVKVYARGPDNPNIINYIAGGSPTGSVEWTPASAGHYIIVAYFYTLPNANPYASADTTLDVVTAPPPPDPWIQVSVSPSSVQKGQALTISIQAGNVPSGGDVFTQVRDPSGAVARTYAGTGEFRYVVPSDAWAGTWSVVSQVLDSGGSVLAQDSASFTVSASSYYYYVSVVEESVQPGGTIHLSVSTNYQNPGSIKVYLRDPSGSTLATWPGDSVPGSYTLPSDAQTGTWRVAVDQVLNVDTRGDSFSVTSGGGSGTSSWIRIRSVYPKSPYEGQALTVKVRYNYAGTETYKRVRLLAFGQELIKSAYDGKNEASFSLTPTKPGTFTINAVLEERKFNPVVGYYWSQVASDSYMITVSAKMETQLILEFPKKVHVGDLINITVRLMRGGSELDGKACKLYVDQGVHDVLSGQTFTIMAKRTGTIDVSAEFGGDEAHKPSKNGGGLIEVWTKPTIEITSVSCGGGS